MFIYQRRQLVERVLGRLEGIHMRGGWPRSDDAESLLNLIEQELEAIAETNRTPAPLGDGRVKARN